MGQGWKLSDQYRSCSIRPQTHPSSSRVGTVVRTKSPKSAPIAVLPLTQRGSRRRCLKAAVCAVQVCSTSCHRLTERAVGAVSCSILCRCPLERSLHMNTARKRTDVLFPSSPKAHLLVGMSWVFRRCAQGAAPVPLHHDGLVCGTVRRSEAWVTASGIQCGGPDALSPVFS